MYSLFEVKGNLTGVDLCITQHVFAIQKQTTNFCGRVVASTQNATISIKPDLSAGFHFRSSACLSALGTCLAMRTMNICTSP